MYKKIFIVGIYGSGKSTLAKKMSKIINVDPVDLDEVKYIRKYDKIKSVNERKEHLRKTSKNTKFIVEGAWLDYAIDIYKSADIVIFLQIPEWKLYWRIFLRHFKRMISKTKYHDLNLKTTFKIMKRVHQYYHGKHHFMTLNTHLEYIKKHAKKHIIIKNKDDIDSLMSKIGLKK